MTQCIPYSDTINQYTKNDQQKSTTSSRKQHGMDKYAVYGRVYKLLSMFNEWTNKNEEEEDEKESVYQMVCAQYDSHSLSPFFKDYEAVISRIDSDRLFIQNKDKCAVSSCSSLKRNYRNRSVLSTDNLQRTALYFGLKHETEIIVIQHLDILHNALYHIIHCGLRAEPMDNALNAKRTKQNRKRRRTAFDQIRGFGVQQKQNKFVSYFGETKENDDEKGDGVHEYGVYAAGIRYYYHDRYRNIHVMGERIPGTPYPDYGNHGYKISDWFIIPKHSDLKQEILKNDSFSFSVQQWDSTALKAEYKWKEYNRSINRADELWHEAYGFTKDSIIGIQHILCLILYTDFDFLNTKLSETYRKRSSSESDQELKTRHSHFAHFGKFLKECVEVFGRGIYASNHKEFYHGINRKMLFNAFYSKFSAPTSTSLFKEVAVNFAGEGIVITIQNSKDLLNHFNCISFSAFPGEAEMLFISGLNPLPVIGLTDLSLSAVHDDHIRAIKILQTCLEGNASSDQLTESLYGTLTELLSIKLSSDSNPNEPDNASIPPYVADIFGHLLQSLPRITIDIGLFKVDIAGNYGNGIIRYGYNKLSALFMDASSEWIKLEIFNKLVPDIKHIHIKCIDIKTANYKYLPSIMVTDEILIDIHSALTSYWSLKSIQIYSPKNTSSSMSSLLRKYKDMFGASGYRVSVREKNNPQYGKCDVIRIKKQ